MEQTASRIAVLPRRRSALGTPDRRASIAHAASSGCTIHWFRRADALKPNAEPKRIAILDPFEIEQRLLVALAEAQGHRAVAYRGPDDLLAGLLESPPHIAFVHICFDHVMRGVAETRPLPPIVLIDSSSIAGQGQGQIAPLGDFTAIRFPIGLHEFTEAIRRSAR
jgi:hypothetical protein